MRRHAKRVDVPRVAYDRLAEGRLPESSESVRARVEAVREKQRLRFVGTTLASNADTRSGPAGLRSNCKLDDAGTSPMRTAMNPLQLPARGFHQVL